MKLLTKRETAELLRVSERTIDRLRQLKLISSVRGSCTRVVSSICKRLFSVYALEAKTMTTEVASVRLPRGTVARLRMLAHKQSLEKTQDLSWSDILREVIARMLNDDSERGYHHVQ